MSNDTRLTIALLDAVQDAFNRHDVDGILSYFAEDGEWLMARGPDPWEAKRLRLLPATPSRRRAGPPQPLKPARVPRRFRCPADGSSHRNRRCSSTPPAPRSAPARP